MRLQRGHVVFSGVAFLAVFVLQLEILRDIHLVVNNLPGVPATHEMLSLLSIENVELASFLLDNDNEKARQVINSVQDDPKLEFPGLNVQSTHNPSSCTGKERIVSILRAAETNETSACALLAPHKNNQTENMTNVSRVACDYELVCRQLPSWADVTGLYGDKPVILGLETCERYRALLSNESKNGEAIEPMIRVAGLYNTGTNALSKLFLHHFIERNNGTRARYSSRDGRTVPWGKHVAAKYRLTNNFPVNTSIVKAHVLPVVLVRDPYRWMTSMCTATYWAKWERHPIYCPNLVVDKARHPEIRSYAYPVIDRVDQARHNNVVDHYFSIANMWSEWNKQYLDADFPRLIIRFEDTIFHLDEVMHEISKCAGLEVENRGGSSSSSSTLTAAEQPKYFFPLSSAKNHGNPSNFVSTMITHGTNLGRHGRMDPESFAFSKSALDRRLMEAFHYPYGEYSPLFVKKPKE